MKSNTQGSRIEGGLNIRRALGVLNEITARNTEIQLTQETAQRKALIAIEAAQYYHEEIEPHLRSFVDAPLTEIIGADGSENIGTLAGVLVLQQALPLYKYNFPWLGQLWNDLSPSPGLFNQTENSRIITAPAVQEYDSTLDDTGRPKGWETVSPSQTVDVPVRLDKHIGVPIVFGQTILGSTLRKLFDEQGQAAVYAVAKYFVAKAAALITPGNFNAYAEVNGDLVPDAYATYQIALKDFGMGAVDDLEAIFDANEVPEVNRGMLLNAKYHGQLRKDPRLGLFFAAMQTPEMVTEGKLPKLNGFLPTRAPWLPKTNNVRGFAFHKAAIVLKQRLPVDFSQALPGVMVPGSVTTVIDPESGLSSLLVQYINMRQGYAEWRLEVMLGAAPGDKRGGLCITGD